MRMWVEAEERDGIKQLGGWRKEGKRMERKVTKYCYRQGRNQTSDGNVVQRVGVQKFLEGGR